MTDTPCLFCAIAGGHLPAHVIHQDDTVMAFLDIQPVRPGHTLIIPRRHHVWFEDLPADTAARIHGVERVSFAFTGIDVAHAHAHIVPMHELTDVISRRQIVETDLTFRPMPRAEPEALAATADALRAALAGR